jgi:hypothetical protein
MISRQIFRVKKELSSGRILKPKAVKGTISLKALRSLKNFSTNEMSEDIVRQDPYSAKLQPGNMSPLNQQTLLNIALYQRFFNIVQTNP